MKNIAVITNIFKDFNQYRLERQCSDEPANYIQVKDPLEVPKYQFNDYVNKSNSVKMPNVNAIIKAVENNINQLN